MRKLVVLLIFVALLGCVRAPQQRDALQLDTPERFETAESNEAPLDAWWSSFDDAQLSALIDEALEHNYDLIAAARRVDRAAAQATIAGADLKPTIGAGLNGNRSKQNFVGFPIPGAGGGVLSTTATRYQLSLDTSWEIDLWGRLRAGTRAALADAQAAEAEYRAAKLSLAGQVAKLWFAIQEANEQLELARTTVENFQQSSELVRTRYEAGVRPSIDLRLALSNQHSAEALIALRETQLDAAQRQLEVLLGRYPSANVQSDDPLATLPGSVPVGLPADLIARRPDLIAAERRLAAADERLFAAQRARYPQISLTASGGTVSNQLEDLIDGDFRVWSLIGNIVGPVFQGGRIRAGIELNEAIGNEILAGYASQALRAYAEVEGALANESRLRDRERHLRETAEQLAGAESLASSRYSQGVGNYLTVLESQTRALNARSEWIQLRRELLTNRVDLHLALGGGFEKEAQP